MIPQPEQRRFPWKRLLALAVTLVAVAVVARKVDLRRLGEVLLQTHPGWFAAAVGSFGLAIFCAGCRWHLMLRLTGCAVHPGASQRGYLIGHGLNFFFFGPAVGDVVKSALYAKWHERPLSAIIAAAPLDRLLGLVGMIIFCVLTFGLAAWLGVTGKVGGQAPQVPIQFVTGMVVILAGFVVVCFKFKTQSQSALARTYRSFAEGMQELVRQPRVAFPGVALGFLVQVASCALLALCLKAVVTQPYPWVSMLWTFPVIAAIAVAPSIGGLGVRDGAAMVILGLFAVPAADAVAMSLLALATHLIWAGAGGVLLWNEDRRFRRFEKTAPWKRRPQSLSIIIPTLNEAAALPETLRRVKLQPEVCEVIVVDGGSTDGSAEVAREWGCTVVSSPPGRGGQLRAGTQRTQGDVLLLLHADTWLPDGAGLAALDSLRDVMVVGGGFWKVFPSGVPWLMRGSRIKCALRLWVAGRVAGDQALFIRREALEAVGGVPDMPLMEEFELCARMRRLGRLTLAGATVTTSARRFSRLGVVRTYLRMWWVTLRYRCGTPPLELKRIYERE